LAKRVIIIDHGKIFFDGPLHEIIDRFSHEKIISLTFTERAARDFSAYGEVVEQTPVSVQLKVPRAHVTEVSRRLLETCHVSDINVQEIPVEDVIRQLFGEQRSKKNSEGREAELLQQA
jgi:ABC-2 type transport system ATP-binding protein